MLNKKSRQSLIRDDDSKIQRTNNLKMDELKLELKLWEKSFEKLNGRLPGKHDIKTNHEIKRKYKEYAMLRKNQPEKSVNLSDSTPKKDEVKSVLELGPTPQISGKLVSIFEINVSPLKQDNAVEAQVASSPVKLKNSTVRRQLNFNCSITPNSSPVKLRAESRCDVLYSKYGPNSPLKVDDVGIRVSGINGGAKEVPNVNSTPFSPSPLIKRPTKYLHEFAEEHKIIKDEFDTLNKEFPELSSTRKLEDILQREIMSDSCDLEDHAEDDSIENQPVIKKAKTLKKKTKPKLRPKMECKQVREIDLPVDNVHEQIAKLKRGEPYIYTDEYKDKTESKINISKKPRKSKYNLVSNNFKRLKLPTRNRNNSRWSRRR